MVDGFRGIPFRHALLIGDLLADLFPVQRNNLIPVGLRNGRIDEYGTIVPRNDLGPGRGRVRHEIKLLVSFQKRGDVSRTFLGQHGAYRVNEASPRNHEVGGSI